MNWPLCPFLTKKIKNNRNTESTREVQECGHAIGVGNDGSVHVGPTLLGMQSHGS